MIKKYLLAASILAGVLMFPHIAAAHVLITDKATGTGAILHLNPDDDPIAGQAASLFFDIQDTSLASQTITVKLTITDDHNQAAVVATQTSGSTVSADYTFPRQGLYHIDLVVLASGRPLHTFTLSQRVSRGVAGDVAQTSPPAWAEIGVVLSILAAMAIAIIAFNRRRDIHRYSR